MCGLTHQPLCTARLRAAADLGEGVSEQTASSVQMPGTQSSELSGATDRYTAMVGLHWHLESSRIQLGNQK